MSLELSEIPTPELRAIATAIRSGRLRIPLSTIAIKRVVTDEMAERASKCIERLTELGFELSQVASVLDVLAADREGRVSDAGLIDLVTTGPDGAGANRDTGVVVRELCGCATKSVLIAGYAVYQGKQVFQVLAERMKELPDLEVSMFFDIQRPRGDSSTASQLIQRFATRFREKQWPTGCPLPKVYFDPRSLESTTDKRACLHAKCVVIDGERVFVSSANFTEAAQLRNIELGVCLESPATANQIITFFKGLVDRHQLWLLKMT